MPETKGAVRKWLNVLVFGFAATAAIYFAVSNFSAFVHILIVALGFGAVVIIHEFGHFIVAKLSGIKVEAFSIGFPPTLLGIQRTETGIRFRVLPRLFAKEQQPDDRDGEKGGRGAMTSQVVQKLAGKKKYEASDTEYRIGAIPFGGFVKMLGQDDTGPAEETDDPRSFSNKPILIRIAVVAAGVVFNAISAVMIFMVVFLIGVDLPPAVVGSVRPASPAQRAGLRPGDRVLEVNGERFVDFTTLLLAAGLSTGEEPVSLVVKHTDGITEEMEILAEMAPGADLRSFGISQAETLTVARLSAPEDIAQLYETTGLKPADVVTAFDGQVVENVWQMNNLIKDSLQPNGVLTVERTDARTGNKKMVDVKLPLYLPATKDNFSKTEGDLVHIFSLVPRLKVLSAPDRTKPPASGNKLISWWNEKILRKQPVDETGPFLQAGDIIVKIADTEYPTYAQLREVTQSYENRSMPITVLRKTPDGAETLVTVETTPKRVPGSEPARVNIGIYPVFDAEHPVVAGTVSVKEGLEPLDIPCGAQIVAIDGEEVADFYDIMRIICKNRGQRISLDYRIGEDGGGVGLNIPADDDYITAENSFAPPVPAGFVPTAYVPFEYLKETYEAAGAVEAVKMGLKKTSMFIAQTYMTLKRLISKDVKPTTLVGPVGIVTMSYRIVSSQSLTYYVYFLGLISSVIAVMNLLPLPIVDGGVIVLLMVEKIKGSPLSRRAQEVISYIGLVFIIAVFVLLTYNDILNMFFR
ncbi:MAG TPA: PDZ domain-containing protein [Planctomycetes bacterium]|nr:PDZ domain-containing protein [Planctomycetota bacterium]HIJ71404.1 PDZ domain-containing protein [Planctomycetota bacterium]